MSAAEEIVNDESRDWDERIRAAAELEHKKIERVQRNRERARAVPNEKRQQYREAYYEKEMTEIFESFEWLLYESFLKSDSIMTKISTEASACQIPGTFREKYMREKVLDMFEQIAEQREGKKNAM